jgi:hypothetical protein
MKTTIYWAMRHGCRAMHELRFRATCWWLSQQVEFLEWRLRNSPAQNLFTFNDSHFTGRTTDLSPSC